MDIPGLADDPELVEKAEQESERLREQLKKEARAEVQDIGTLRKELRITVPARIIADHLAHNYEELRQDALVPGFRKGRAPLKLVEKRFGSDVRDSAKTTIIGQAYFAVVENEDLAVLGDPLFRVSLDDGVQLMDLTEALEHFELPDNEDFTYVCEVEVKPAFELPELKGIEVQTPQIEITEQDVTKYLERQGKIRGRYEPLSAGAAQPEDLVIADVALKVDDAVVTQEENVQLSVRPSRLNGIALTTLDEALKGARPGERRSVECEIPDDFERADLRGKAGCFEFTIHELKRLVPLGTDALVEQMGAASEEQLRQFVREDLQAELGHTVSRAKKQQVLDYLLEHTVLDLPPNLSARQIERAVLRRIIDLRQSGIPQSEIDAHIDELRSGATEQATRDLKLDFILDKVAEQLGVTVSDEEVNTEIARIARLYNRRFDRTRDELEKQGALAQLAEQIRQDKCVEQLLRDAKLVEVRPEEQEPKNKAAKKSAPAETAKKKTAAARTTKRAAAEKEGATPPKSKPRKSRKKKAE